MDRDELTEELASLGRELLLALLLTAASVLVRAALQRLQYGSLLNKPSTAYRKPVPKSYVFEEEDEDDYPTFMR